MSSSSENLSKQAMLSHLHIRVWGATLTDRKVSAEVATKHGVTEKRAGKYRKHVIDVQSIEYRAVRAAASDLRMRHYWHTLPWGEDGGRILPAASFEAYAAEQRTLRKKFDAAVADFVAAYPKLVAEATKDLGGLFNASDYPADIGSKFGVDCSIMPLPTEHDFRASLPAAAVAEIKQNITKEVERTTESAMREPYQRLYDHISRMVERLEDPKAIFRDTLVTGLAELCSVLPALNITNDTRLDELRKRAESLVTGLDPQTLRDDYTARADVLSKAEEIQDAMAAFMGVAS
jgi:hypothetical protein